MSKNTKAASRRSNPHFDAPRAEARPLALEICRAAVAEWERAKATHAAARERYEASEAHKDSGSYEDAHEWERWVEFLWNAAYDAQRRVMTCALMVTGRVDWAHQAEKMENGWKPVSFELDGTHYVVGPADEADDPRPTLTVVDGDDFESCQYGRGGDS